MLRALGHPVYRRLFAAQLLSLVGTGLATVALALLAWELAGERAGAVLGVALAIKMVAYVGVSQLAAALLAGVPRRRLLIALDLVRAGLVLLLPFASEIWHVYALVFLYQSCSAAFTPVFQATIPDVLADERDYAAALSLSRLAYDLEALASPLAAALLLTVMGFDVLFVLTTLGFLASAGLLASIVLPQRHAEPATGGWWARVGRAARYYLATPPLRGLLALHFTAAAVGSMVLVNSIVYARDTLGGGDMLYTLLLAAYGVGSMAVALALRPALERAPLRRLMLAGAGLLVGAALAGLLGAQLGLGATFLVMAALAAGAGLAASRLWRASDELPLAHGHAPLEHLHLHVHDAHHQHEHAGWEGPEPHRHPHRHQPQHHVHAMAIDLHHPRWPTAS